MAAILPKSDLVSRQGIPEWGLGPFVKQVASNPILSPHQSVFDCPMRGPSVAWEGAYVFNPAAVVRNGQVTIIYRAEDGLGEGLSRHTSCLGMATSEDGLHFSRRNAPVLYPDDDHLRRYEWPGGCEDPRVVECEDGSYVLLYSAWDREIVRLCSATSTDLSQWTKHGPVFAKAHNGKFHDTWSKAGAIVTRLAGDRLVAAKINGKYWMYWGEGDIYAATSSDLIHWQPVLDAAGELLPLISVREGMFDSSLCEPGPPALLTDDGIVLLYNGRNDETTGAPSLGPGTYCAGQALFDPNQPAKLLDRTSEPFFQPDEHYERTGQYVGGTVFIEGLVYFHHQWILYYGTADSHVAAAVWSP